MSNPSPKPGPGRPKGSRNKVTKEIAELAQPYGPEAIATLARLLKSKQPGAQVAAARELLDRAYGRAPQAITGPAGGAFQAILEVVTGVPRAPTD